MNCRRCHRQNEEGSRFCAACGASLDNASCPGCGADLPPDARFCPQCGAAVSADPEVAGERRQLTVMFCDLVGSTELSSLLDPEEFADVLNAYRETCAGIVEGLEGRVAQYLGDGVLVYFGHPRAHEDDGVRALNAALGIRDALPELSAKLGERLPSLRSFPLRARIGVHTGPVVVGGVSDHGEQLAVGETVNLASRLLSVADPEEVVTSHPTWRLAQGAFITDDLGEHDLEGVSGPVRVWRVQLPSGVPSRLETGGVGGPTRLVGRVQELSLLVDRWERARLGPGRALLIRGEAGIGKTRLVHALHQLLEDQVHTWIECRCSPYRQGSAFHPIVGFLEQVIGLRRDDPPEARVATLELALRRSGFPLEETMPLFASLLSIPLPDGYPAPPVGREEVRQRTFQWLTSWLELLGSRQPVAMVIEDLHWSDPSTLELLGHYLEVTSRIPLFFVFTGRPEFEPPWAGVEQLILPALTQQEAEMLAHEVAGDLGLPERAARRVAERADGVPLFVEELTQSAIEASEEQREAATEAAVPFTIQDSLMARLDRLGAAKEVAQLAAVLGREFAATLLERVSPQDSEALAAALRELVTAGVLRRSDAAPAVTYRFKHALVREAAYQSLLHRTRRSYHGRVAEALESHFPEVVASMPDLVAFHWEQAGEVERAITHYGRAAQEAANRSANAESIRHLRKGLELVESLPPSPARDELELGLQVGLMVPLVASHGYADPDVARACARARELCPKARPSPQLFRALYGLSTFYQASGEFGLSTELGEQCLALAEKTGDSGLRIVSEQRLGLCRFYAGEPARALEHLEEGIALYDPAEHRRLAFVYGHDVNVLCHLYSALALCASGRLDLARRRTAAALADAREIGHPHTLAFALCIGGVAYINLGDGDRVRDLAAEAVELADERGFPLWAALARELRGWSGKGSASDVIEMRAGMTALENIGFVAGRVLSLWLLADAQKRAGNEDDALASLDVGLSFSARHGNPYWDSSLLRSKGEILQARGETETAREVLEQAVEVARDQGALGLEVCAAAILERLLRDQGRDDEASALALPIYERFAELFETFELETSRDVLALFEGCTTADLRKRFPELGPMADALDRLGDA